MAAQNQTVLKIRTEIENLQGLNQLKTAVRRVSAEAKSANNDFGRLTGRIKELQGATVQSINNLKAQRQAFDALRNSVDVTSKEFKQATQEIEALDKKLAKVEGRKVGGGRLRAGAQIAGTVAGAGVFGGPEGAIAAGIGGIVGGVPGAIVGGAIGAQLGGIRQALGATAEYGAELTKLRIALQGVTTSQEEYSAALQIIQRATTDFAIPQDVLTRQFTRLQASVQGAGGTVSDTEIAFKGITAAVRATGGSLADVDAALTATAQVFSKGKVSAEELRGQIGERLPGAFTLFAEAIGKTPMELDKALQDGKVSLEDFQTFAEQLFERYGETAQIIADGPESAGDRLKVALANLSESVGTLLAPIGQFFQETFTEVIEIIDQAARRLNDFFGLSRDRRLSNAVQEVTRRQTSLELFRQRTGEGPLSAAGQRQLKVLEDSLAEAQSNLNRIRDEISIEVDGTTVTQPTAGTRRFGLEERGERGRPSGGGKVDPMARLRKQSAEEFRALNRSFAEIARLRLSKETAEIELQIIDAQKQGNEQLAFQLKQKLEMRKIDLNIEGLTEQIRKGAAKIAETKKKGVDVTKSEEALIKQQNSLLILQTEKQKILAEQAKDRFLFEQKIKEEIEAQQKSFEQQFTDRQRELGLIPESDYNQILLGREEARLAAEFPGVSEGERAQMLDLYRQEIDPTPFEAMRQNITQLRESLRELVDPVNQITGAATAIGDAFSQSFVDAISGAKTAKEALADFFSSVGSYFLDMAKQIIAKMIQIAILNSVAKLLPSTSLTTSAGVSMSAGTATQSGFSMGSALAGMFKANGGPVNANQPYIVGERGPELFMPSSSGSITSNENLQAQNRAFLDSIYTENGGTASDDSEAEREATIATRAAIRESERIQENRMQIMSQQKEFDRRYERERIEQMASTPGKLDIKYESQVINNVEYVTREQAERMAAQSALRGRELAIGSLQNSVKTRKRVGI